MQAKLMGWWFGSGLAALGLLGCGNGSSSGGTNPGVGGSGGKPGVILDGGGEIPDAPDGVKACMTGACNYQAQDCPSGESCLPTDTPPATGDWPPKCFSPGTKATGESCTAWNDCVKGDFCLGIGAAADGGIVPGTCRQLCCGGDWAACGSGTSCIQQVYLVPPGGGAAVYAKADVCAPVGGCDPLAPTSCTEAGHTCQIVDPIGDVACMPEGTGTAGQACSPSAPCKGGFACVKDVCRRLCRAVEGGGEPSCKSGEGICVHFNRDPAGVGECTPR